MRHHPTWWTGTAAAPWVEGALVWGGLVATAGISGVAVAAALGCARSEAPPSSTARSQILFGGSLALTIVLLVAAHVVADVLYPKERTALYLVPLFIGGLVALAGSYRRGPVRWCALAMLSILSLTSIEQFTTGSYGEWPYDAGSRRIAELLAAESARRERPIRVAATQFLYQPALEFYRLTRFHDRVDLVLDGFDPLRAGDFDLVVVNDEDGRRLPGSCDEIYVDPVSGARVRQCARDTAADARPRAVGTSGPDAAP